MTDPLTHLADQIDSQAAISARPGQLAELERIAAQLRGERDRLHSWAGLMSLLDEHYPADVFTGDGESGDPGPRIIALLRVIDALRRYDAACAALWKHRGRADRLRDALAELVALKDGPRDEHYREAKDAAWQRARDLLS